jgi:hypothetical protein
MGYFRSALAFVLIAGLSISLSIVASADDGQTDVKDPTTRNTLLKKAIDIVKQDSTFMSTAGSELGCSGDVLTCLRQTARVYSEALPFDDQSSYIVEWDDSVKECSVIYIFDDQLNYEPGRGAPFWDCKFDHAGDH